ncbi:MAG: hypothetical protein IMHGJWDQ_001674, partial [Candidatus Fervidibacter sp.]
GGGGGISLQIYATETTAHFSGWEHSVRIYRRNEDIVEIRGEGKRMRQPTLGVSNLRKKPVGCPKSWTMASVLIQPPLKWT